MTKTLKTSPAIYASKTAYRKQEFEQADKL